MKKKEKVLIICSHNSARSQMAEAFLKQFGGSHFEAESAGLAPGTLNPVVVEVMKEIGIDISNNNADSVFKFFKEGRLYDYVITVCDETTAERCPVFPGVTTRLHWDFKDPSAMTGTEEEVKTEVRKIRDQIKAEVKKFIRYILPV
jgi:arsenate reductase